MPGSAVAGGTAGGGGHKPREKEEATVRREDLEATEGSEGREAESSASKGKAKVPEAAGPSQLRILKAGVAQSALHQRITDDANARAKKQSIFAVGRLQKQFTRSMRQIESSMGPQAPIEETDDAGNDTITSCSDVESDIPSHSGPSANSAPTKDAPAKIIVTTLTQHRLPESSGVRAQSNRGQQSTRTSRPT